MTDCNPHTFDFQDLGRRKLQANFSGGNLSNEGGLLLISELDHGSASPINSRSASPTIETNATSSIHCRSCCASASTDSSVAMKISTIMKRCGAIPFFATAVGKTDPLGEGRIGEDKGNPLAGKSTLNRLKTTNAQTQNDYHKIHANHADIEKTLIETRTRSFCSSPLSMRVARSWSPMVSSCSG